VPAGVPSLNLTFLRAGQIANDQFRHMQIIIDALCLVIRLNLNLQHGMRPGAKFVSTCWLLGPIPIPDVNHSH
jgi:hypothetical protein